MKCRINKERECTNFNSIEERDADIAKNHKFHLECTTANTNEAMVKARNHAYKEKL